MWVLQAALKFCKLLTLLERKVSPTNKKPSLRLGSGEVLPVNSYYRDPTQVEPPNGRNH